MSYSDLKARIKEVDIELKLATDPEEILIFTFISRATMLASIDLIWDGLQRELNALGTRAPLPLGKINAPAIAANQLDRFIPWFDIVVGLGLLLGLCTPVAALAGAGFLLSVIFLICPYLFLFLPEYFFVLFYHVPDSILHAFFHPGDEFYDSALPTALLFHQLNPPRYATFVFSVFSHVLPKYPDI